MRHADPMAEGAPIEDILHFWFGEFHASDDVDRDKMKLCGSATRSHPIRRTTAAGS